MLLFKRKYGIILFFVLFVGEADKQHKKNPNPNSRYFNKSERVSHALNGSVPASKIAYSTEIGDLFIFLFTQVCLKYEDLPQNFYRGGLQSCANTGLAVTVAALQRDFLAQVIIPRADPHFGQWVQSICKPCPQCEQ
jgi:hypothetical protein